MKSNKSKNRKSFPGKFILMLLLASFVTVSCNDDDTMVETQTPGDIIAVLDDITANPENYSTDETKSATLKTQKPKFSILRQALVKTKLVSTVASTELTVFAPTDDAFNALFTEIGISGVDDLTAEQLTPILLYHAVAGKVMSTDLSNGYVATVNGASVKIGLDAGVMVNDANVTIADLHAANGVIHVIDKVLLPPTKDLVALALSYDPEFSILVQAVIKADLTNTLMTGGPFTVFAPTNDAFVSLLGELGASSLDDIDVTTLKNVLLYHVVQGRVFSSDLTNGPVTTLNGSFNVNTTNLTITDANSRVVNLVPSLLDVQATNGVIHVIDKVLLP